MTDDTIRTRIIKGALTEWKQWVPWVGGALLAILSLAVAYGGKQEHVANMESNYTKDTQEMREHLDRMESKLDKLSDLPAQVNNLDGRMSRMESNWDNAYEQAGKGIQSHRAQRKH